MRMTILARSKQATEILELLRDEASVRDIYKSNYPEGTLGDSLFRTGTKINEITNNTIQMRFRSSLQNDTLIFYPTQTTALILKSIEFAESTKASIYLSSCKGIGKSFSLALIVYLLRLGDEKTRVLFIHNSSAFLEEPVLYLARELCKAFPDEIIGFIRKYYSKVLQDVKISSENTRNCLLTILDYEYNRPITSFWGLLSEFLEGKKIYVIIDQVNAIENVIISPDWTLPVKIYRNLKMFVGSKGTTILMVSATNEAVTQNVQQEFPIIIID